jgi:hypothetical protein
VEPLAYFILIDCFELSFVMVEVRGFTWFTYMVYMIHMKDDN